MREFQAKRRVERIMYSTGSIALVLLLIGFLAKATYGAYQKKQLSQNELTLTKDAYEHLASEKQNLDKSLVFLKTDEGIDTELRSKYRLVRPGENVAVIVEDQEDGRSANAKPLEKQQEGKDIQASAAGWGFVDFFKNIFK